MSSFPSANTVILIGRVLDTPTSSVGDDGRKALSFGIETLSGDDRVKHRVVIADEFVASAMFGSIDVGAVVSVNGLLAYDAEGAMVRVTTQRGSDLSVLGRASTTIVEPQKPASVQGSQSVQPQTAQPSRPNTGPAPRPMPGRPVSPAAQTAAAPQPRPTTPQARPTASAPRPTGLSGLGAMSRQASQDADSVQSEDVAPPANNGAQPRMPQRPPSPPHQGGGYGGGVSGGRGAPLGPTSLDSDIPFHPEWRG